MEPRIGSRWKRAVLGIAVFGIGFAQRTPGLIQNRATGDGGNVPVLANFARCFTLPHDY
jgi:hypothetical protein